MRIPWDELKRFLLDIAKTPDQLACIVETSQGLLIAALFEAGFTVYPVNPKTVDGRRKAAGVKTDAIDAYLLAKTGRSDLADLRKLQPDAPIVAELKLLTRDQDGLIQTQTRLVNQLTACRNCSREVSKKCRCAQICRSKSRCWLSTRPANASCNCGNLWRKLPRAN